MPGREAQLKPGRAARRQARRRQVRGILFLLGGILVANGLVGDRSLIEAMRARAEAADLERTLAVLKQENAKLRHQVQELRQDPRTIEGIARRDLGLIKPGEVLFIITQPD